MKPSELLTILEFGEPSMINESDQMIELRFGKNVSFFAGRAVFTITNDSKKLVIERLDGRITRTGDSELISLYYDLVEFSKTIGKEYDFNRIPTREELNE